METMTIMMTKENKIIKFIWNNELSECNHVALGVTDEEFNFIIESKGHEGATVDGWKTKIKM